MKQKGSPARGLREVRVHSTGPKFELRQNADGSRTIVGYASVFAPAFRSQDMGGWVEEIDSHAFDDCLARNPDVRALFNHDPNWVLGRTKSRTLKLSVDSVGLRYEITPNLQSTQANDVLAALERGDVDQSSFAMVCLLDEWRAEDGLAVRRVLQADLYDVSPVTYPAYPDAKSGLRASLRSCPADIKSRLTRRDDDEWDDDNLDCDGMDSDDPRCDDEEEFSCRCLCPACQTDDCQRCSQYDCSEENCEACPAQDEQRSDSLRLQLMLNSKRNNLKALSD